MVKPSEITPLTTVAPRRAARRGRTAGRCRQHRHRRRRPRRRPARRAPRRRPGLLHRRPGQRHEGGAGRRRRRQEGRPRTRRQEPQRRLRRRLRHRRGLRHRRRPGAERRLHPQRPGLLGRLPAHRRGVGARPLRRRTRPPRREDQARPRHRGRRRVRPARLRSSSCAKTEAYVASALAEGARAALPAAGAPSRPTSGPRPATSTSRPSSTSCHREMRVVREEVFGPVLTVETFRTEDEAVALANDTEYGLAGARLDRRRGPRPAGRRPAAARHRLDQRLPPLPPAGGVGRLRQVRHRARTRPRRARRVPRDQARLPEPRAAARPLVRGLTPARTAAPDRASTWSTTPCPVRVRLRRRRRRHRRLGHRLPAHREPGRHRRRHRGRPQRRRPRRRPDPAPLDGPARRRTRLRLPDHRAAARQLAHPAQPRPGARRLLLAQHPHRLQAAAVRLGRVGGGGRQGLGRGADGPVLRAAAQQHRAGRRGGPERHRPRLRRRRAGRARRPARRGLQQEAVPRGRRLLRPRLPPGEQQALLRLRRLPAPLHGRAPNLHIAAGDLGVPAGAGRHPARPGACTYAPRTARSRSSRARREVLRLRRRGGHPAAAAALRHRPAGRPGGARHPRRARPAGRRREPARPPRVGDRLGDRRADPGELRDGLRRGPVRPARPASTGRPT